MNTPNQNLHDHWSRQRTVYQIYPFSFKDGNGDGWGDLQGIVEKLDYLQFLGIGAVWICPFYKSPMADFGYDVEDYRAIDPKFGDMADFDNLVAELHKRDIKLIIDFVGNHTSVKHEWFKDSRSSRTAAKRDWYVWRDPKPDGNPPTNWISVFGGSAWEFDRATGQYYLHSFLKEQPDLNWHNSEVREAMKEVMDFWIAKGVDGFRIDALENIIEDENAHDDPVNPEYKAGRDGAYQALVHRFSMGDATKMGVVGSLFNEMLEKHPDLFIIGEVYAGIEEMQKLYELCPGGRFAPFNFGLVGLPWDASQWKKSIDAYEKALKPHHLRNYTLGNHDIARVATRFGEAQAGLAAFLQFTLPGMPFIYYGDELGMTNGVIEPHAIRDVLAKIFRGFNSNRDLERTPMQWDDSPHAGFSKAKPWLPVTPNYRTLNVAHETADRQSMLSLYITLIQLRQSLETLRVGEYVERTSPSANIFSFERKRGDERLLVIANFSDSIEHESIASDEISPGKEPSIVFTTNPHRTVHMSSRDIELLPYEGYVIRL